MMLTRATDMVDDNGVPFDEDKVLSAMLSNVFVFSGDNFTSERSLETENYTQSFDGVPVLEIAGATYTRLIDTAHPDVQGGGFRLEELGALRSQSDTSGTVGVNIEQPVVFLQSDALNTSVPVDDAPLSGFIALSASDTSTLEVDATRGGVNLQNYTLTQRGTEFTIDDMWTVDPVSTSLRLLE